MGKKGERYKVFEETIYHRDREDRIQQAFELIIPDLAREAIQDKKGKARVVDTTNSQSEVKTKKAQ